MGKFFYFIKKFFYLDVPLEPRTCWTKIDQKLTCPMPDDGEELQICSWRIGDEGVFKSSYKKSHGDRLR